MVMLVMAVSIEVNLILLIMGPGVACVGNVGCWGRRRGRRIMLDRRITH